MHLLDPVAHKIVAGGGGPGEVGVTSGIPREHALRKAIIYQPAKGVVGGSTGGEGGRTKLWRLEFKETGDKWTNPLMGWTSTRDPLSWHHMTFETAGEAEAFAPPGV